MHYDDCTRNLRWTVVTTNASALSISMCGNDDWKQIANKLWTEKINLELSEVERPRCIKIR